MNFRRSKILRENKIKRLLLFQDPFEKIRSTWRRDSLMAMLSVQRVPAVDGRTVSPTTASPVLGTGPSTGLACVSSSANSETDDGLF